MKQVVQSISGGPIKVIDVPRPTIGPTQVLVQTAASIISPGTERAVTALAESSLVAKARARPDLVRQVLKKARSEGLAPTVRAVRARLDDDLPLGYSAAGIAVEVGEAISGVVPGQLVATAGAGHANHAEFQAVPGLLCAPVPGSVAPGAAAFSTIASIALHALRLADVGPGARVGVIGLGLVGQLAVRLAQAAGCLVAGIDISDFPVEFAEQAGALALVERGDETSAAILEWSNSRGVDAVLLTASGKSSAAIARTPVLCRDRATIVVVGDVGLDLSRTPLYEKELALRFARSYGPGRYERSYEEWGVDYPAGFVRWTEGRNLEAVLDLIAAGRLEVDDLVTHRFDIADASSAYRLIQSGREPYLGVQLIYPPAAEPEAPIPIRPPRATAGSGVGLIGAGSFAGSVLVPAMKQAGFGRLVSVASASGLSARRLADDSGFEKAAAGAGAVISDPDVAVVAIATPHDSHAALTVEALRAGKHVFCEKPLALTFEELDDVEKAWRDCGRVLFVGFNRRWSEPIARVREHFSSGTGPCVITYRVNAGSLPDTHWYHDRRQGGRLLGEVCHFVDTCAAIVGTDAIEVRAVGSARGELLLADDLIVTLAYGDGSIATITYASGGHPSMDKERIDVIGRGHSASIIDFRQVTLNGKSSRLRTQDKGHVAEMCELLRQIRTGEHSAETSLGSTRTVLEAATQLGGSHPGRRTDGAI